MKNQPGTRQIRVGETIQKELAPMILRELNDDRLKWVTISDVDVSPDLTHARVFFTLLDSENRETVTQALHQHATLLRRLLSKRLSLRVTPRLNFMYDESVERGSHLSQLIDKANRLSSES